MTLTIEISESPDAHEPKLVEAEVHLRKRKYEGQPEELVKSLPHSKVLHVMDESERICGKCGTAMVRHGPFPKPGDNIKLSAGCIPRLAFPCGTTFKTGTAETEILAHR